MGFNIYVTGQLAEPALELLRSSCAKVDINPEDQPLSAEDLRAAVRGRDGIVCFLSDTIDAAVMDAAAEAAGFAVYAVGYNNVDVAGATERGLLISNTPGVLTDATADLAWALLFAAARRIVESDAHFRTGSWQGWGPMQFLGADITGKTLGVVGPGRIGTNFALKSRGFGMHVLYAGRHANADLNRELGASHVPLETLLEESDFVSLHVPLLPETRHLIGREELARMKPGAILINTARGPVVDETALVDALRDRRIAAAGLDVYEDEPQPKPGLVELPNVVCCCHIGSATLETRTKMAMMAAENLLAMMRGERPPNLVNPEAFDRRK